MYFKATVTDKEVRIQATHNIKDAMMAVTIICNDINKIKEYSESDRAVFRDFVKEELAKLAFADVDELAKEHERLAKIIAEKKQKNQKNLERILKELSELLDFDEEESEDENE